MVRRRGSDAEDLVADYLLSLGYTLLTRRAKVGRGELDLVALDGEVLVFVEVKSRDGGWGSAEESVSLDKQGRLASAAEEYLVSNGLEGREVRFDVVAVSGGKLRHLKAAF